MTKRKVLFVPERLGGIVRLREVVWPATGLDALRDIIERIDRLERRLPPAPAQPPRRARQ